MRSRHRHLAAGLAISALLGIVVAPADANWFDRIKKKSAPESQRPRPRRFEIAAPLVFQGGRLGHAGGSNWTLGSESLILTEKTNIRRLDDPEASIGLMDGAEVYVMGKRSGGMLVCSEIMIVPYISLATTSWSNQESIQWSDSDPTVGIYHGPY